MSRSVEPDPLHTDPVAWFARLERAVREQDFLIANEAKHHLSQLGWDVRQEPRRKVCKLRQTARGQGGGQMTPAPRCKSASGDPGPLKLADRPAPRPLAAGIEPMLSIDDLAALLSCSRRLVERMRSAGKVPTPDLHVGRMPRWRPETIRRWITEGGVS